MAQEYSTDALDKMIRTTLKMFKEASPHQVWSWAGNRENDLTAIGERMQALAAAGTLEAVQNAWPPAYRLARKGKR